MGWWFEILGSPYAKPPNLAISWSYLGGLKHLPDILGSFVSSRLPFCFQVTSLWANACNLATLFGDQLCWGHPGFTNVGEHGQRKKLPEIHSQSLMDSYGSHLTLNVAPKMSIQRKTRMVPFFFGWIWWCFFVKKEQPTNYQIAIFASVWRLLPWMVLLKSFWTSCCKARRRIKKPDRKQKICWEGKGTSKWQTSWVTSNDRNVGVQSFMLDELVKICWRMWFKNQIYLGH